MLLAVVQAAPQAAPVVHEVVKTVQVPVVPDYVIQLLNLAYLAVPAYLASFLHDFVYGALRLKDKLAEQTMTLLNVATLFAYSFLISAVVVWYQGQLNFDLSHLDTILQSLFVVVGVASARYAVLKAKAKSDAETKALPVVANP